MGPATETEAVGLSAVGEPTVDELIEEQAAVTTVINAMRRPKSRFTAVPRPRSRIPVSSGSPRQLALQVFPTQPSHDLCQKVGLPRAVALDGRVTLKG